MSSVSLSILQLWERVPCFIEYFERLCSFSLCLTVWRCKSVIMYCRGHGLSRPETGRDRCESRLTRSRCKACFVPIKRPPSKDGGCLLSLSCLRTASPPLRAASSSHVSAPLRRSVRRIVTDPADLTSPTLHVVHRLSTAAFLLVQNRLNTGLSWAVIRVCHGQSQA